ncbi:MAG: LOG family protein [Candidatus Shapirobacteria bacterium]
MIKTTKVIKRVAIFGDAEARENQRHYQLAFKTAKLLAENGYIVMNGGGPGVMLAATLGAKAGGGKVEEVIMDLKLEPDNYEGSNVKSTNLADKVIITKTYPARLNKLIKEADAFVVCKGGTGTLSELGLVWELAKFDYGKHEPVIFLGGFWKKLIAHLARAMNFEKMEKQVVKVVSKPEDVIRVLEQIEALPHGTKSQPIGEGLLKTH